MTPAELRERILRWENPHTDFKSELGSTAELAKDLVCFANSDGGQIIIGVDKDRRVMGVPDPDDLMLKVDDVAFNRCSPPITVVPEVVELDGDAVVVLNVPKGDQRPYRTNDGRYYVRSGTRCRGASREELLRLFQASRSLFYDEQPLPQFGLADIDLDAVARHLAGTEQQDLGDDLPRLLRNPHIYSRVAAAQLGTRAGTGIARISRLLREHSGQTLGIQVSEAQVVLVLPRALRAGVR